MGGGEDQKEEREEKLWQGCKINNFFKEKNLHVSTDGLSPWKA